LPSSIDDHNWRVSEGFGKQGRDVSGVHADIVLIEYQPRNG
jgi:hypothetical protein